MHDGEKANVDRELISIAQMLKFPIQFLEVKKQIEIGDMLEEIKISTINANDNVKEYANQIIAHLEKLQEDQNLFERKNYMVISSFNNFTTVSALFTPLISIKIFLAFIILLIPIVIAWVGTSSNE